MILLIVIVLNGTIKPLHGRGHSWAKARMRWIAKGGMDFDGWRPMECDLLMLEEGKCKRAEG